MTKTKAKQLVKHDLYTAISELAYNRYDDNLKEIIFRVLDEVPSNILEKAIKKGTR